MRARFFCLMLMLGLIITAAHAADKEDAGKVRQEFLTALNALESRHVSGFFSDIPASAALEALHKALDLDIRIHPSAKNALDRNKTYWESVTALRDRLRFSREEVAWHDDHVGSVLKDFARRYGFQLEFSPGVFETAKDAPHPDQWRGLAEKLETVAVSLDRTNATLDELVGDIVRVGRIDVSVGPNVPERVRQFRVTCVTGKKSLGSALARIASLFGLQISFERGKLVLRRGEVDPLPWVEPRGFWVTLKGTYSAEVALQTALTSCRPQLSLNFIGGRWSISKARSKTFPWSKAPEDRVETNLGGRNGFAVLEDILSDLDLALGFPGGRPTVMAGYLAHEAIPVEEVSYSISFLKGSYENFPGNFPTTQNEGLPPMMMDDFDGETWSAMDMRESVLSYVQDLIRAGYLEGDRSHAQLEGSRLKVVATPDVQEKVANFLKSVRSAYRKAIRVSFHFLKVDPGLMQKLIDSGPLSWAALTPAQIDLLMTGLSSGKAQSVKRSTLLAFNGQIVNASAIRQKTYVSDFDVEVAQGAQIGDPIVSVVREGMVAQAQPVAFGGGEWVLVGLKTAVAKVLEPVEKFKTPVGAISMPKVDFQRLGTSVFVRNGGSVLLGGSGNMGVGKSLVLLLSVKTVADDPGLVENATDFHRWKVKVYDVHDLTQKVENHPGPDVGVTIGRRDEGMMAPAFDEMGDDPNVGERWDPDSLVDLIRDRIDPSSWDGLKASIRLVMGYLVVVHQQDRLARIDRLLTELRQRRMKGVEVVTRFLSLKSKDLASIMGAERNGEKRAELDDRQRREILELAAREPKAILSSSSFILLNKQRASMQMGRSIPYVGDVDVEVAQHAAIGDPITGNLLEGVFLDYRAELDPNEEDATLEIRPTIARLKSMAISEIGDQKARKPEDDGDKGDGKDDEPEVVALGRIMLPELEVQKIRTTLNLKSGASALIFCPADAGEESERDLVILLTVRFAGSKKK